MFDFVCTSLHELSWTHWISKCYGWHLCTSSVNVLYFKGLWFQQGSQALWHTSATVLPQCTILRQRAWVNKDAKPQGKYVQQNSRHRTRCTHDSASQHLDCQYQPRCHENLKVLCQHSWIGPSKLFTALLSWTAHVNGTGLWIDIQLQRCSSATTSRDSERYVLPGLQGISV